LFSPFLNIEVDILAMANDAFIVLKNPMLRTGIKLKL